MLLVWQPKPTNTKSKGTLQADIEMEGQKEIQCYHLNFSVAK